MTRMALCRQEKLACRPRLLTCRLRFGWPVGVIGSWPILIANTLTVGVAMAVLWMKWRFECPAAA